MSDPDSSIAPAHEARPPGPWDSLAPHWPALSGLLDEALALPAGERAAWVASLQCEHAALRPALEDLLGAHAEIETGDFLLTLPALLAAPGTPHDAALAPGRRVGPYGLIREIGRGGMADVWLAARTEGLTRQVALKLPHVAWRSAATERFARERDILASLEHPNIARLYDAGVDQLGRPWLALEYVPGRAIDAHCRTHGATTRERVHMLLQVCDAVAYAHGRLVVHRDLKPSNILVTDDGQVRLVDFGIAKLMQAGRTQDSDLTEAAGLALTPDYASPEQLRGDALSTATDVYSMGVVAYELLAGTRPYRLGRGSATALEAAIAAVDPPQASTVAGDPALRRELRGDLDAILNKTLKKAEAERYPTMDALAQDLRRYLAHLPVSARPDSRAYRLRRLVQRHRLTFGAGAVALAALLGGTGVALWQAREATAQASRAEAVANFLRAAFRSASPTSGATVDTRAVDLLLVSRQRALAELAGDPDLQAQTLQIVGDALNDLGALRDAIASYEQALAIESARSRPDAARVRLLRALIADGLVFDGDLARADALLSQSEGGPHAARPEVADAVARMARAQWLYMNSRTDDAVPVAREAVALVATVFGAASRELEDALMKLARIELAARRPADALATIDRTLAMIEKAGRGDADRALRAQLLGQRAIALRDAGQRERSQQQFEQAFPELQAVWGATSPNFLVPQAEYANLRLEQGDAPAAITLLQGSLQAYLARSDTSAQTLGTIHSWLARAQREARRPAESAASYTAAARLLEGAVGPSHYTVQRDLGNAGVQTALTGDVQAGLAQAERARAALLTDGHPVQARQIAADLSLQVAVLHWLDGDSERAAASLAAFDSAEPPPGPWGARRRAAAWTLRGHLALASGAGDAAAAFASARQVLDGAALPGALPERAWIADGLAQLALNAGRDAEALRHAQEATAGWARHAPGSRWEGEAAWWLGSALARADRADEARAELRRATDALARSPLQRDRRLLATTSPAAGNTPTDLAKRR